MLTYPKSQLEVFLMKDDGYRLSFSIKGDGFCITDNLSGKTVIYNKERMVSSDIEQEVVITHICNAQEALMSYLVRRPKFFEKVSGQACNDGITLITEEEHYKWSVSCGQYKGVLHNNILMCDRKFDKMRVLNSINYVYATILGSKPPLNPRKDIVRRIADAGLLVWVYKKDSVAVCEKNVKGSVMSNCIINGDFYPLVIVSSSIELKEVTLFTPELKSILTLPLDNSILAYYPPDEDALDEQEVV